MLFIKENRKYQVFDIIQATKFCYIRITDSRSSYVTVSVTTKHLLVLSRSIQRVTIVRIGLTTNA